MSDPNPISEIKALQAVSDFQSFSTAAQHLGISQSAVSRRIAALEERLGGKRLVARTTRSVRLTEAGAQFLLGAVAAVEQLHQVEQAHLDDEEVARGTLRLSLPPALGRAVCLPALTKVADRHPQLTFELDFSNHYVNFLEDGIDAAIRNRPTDATGVRDEKIGTSSLLLVCSKAYANKLTAVTKGDFSSADFVVPRDEHRRDIEQLYRRLKISRRNVRFFANDMAAVQSLVEHHQGIAVLPDVLVRQALTEGSLVDLELPGSLPPVTHYLSYPAELFSSVRLKVAATALREIWQTP